MQDRTGHTLGQDATEVRRGEVRRGEAKEEGDSNLETISTTCIENINYKCEVRVKSGIFHATV